MPQTVWPQDETDQTRSQVEPPGVESGIVPPGDSDDGGAAILSGTSGDAPKHAHHLKLAAALEKKGELDQARSLYIKALDSEAKLVRDQATAGIQRIDARLRSLRHAFIDTPISLAWSFVKGAAPIAVILLVILVAAKRRGRDKYFVEGFVDAPGMMAAFVADLRDFVDRAKEYYKPRELWLAGHNDSVALAQWSTGLFASPELIKALAEVGAGSLGGTVSDFLVKRLAPEYRISGSVVFSWTEFHVRATLSRQDSVLGSWRQTIPTAKLDEALAQLAYEVAVRLVQQAGGKQK